MPEGAGGGEIGARVQPGGALKALGFTLKPKSENRKPKEIRSPKSETVQPSAGALANSWFGVPALAGWAMRVPQRLDGSGVGPAEGRQSQRDCVLQPRVAESARLPWVSARAILNPNGVASQLHHRAPTPLGLADTTRFSQGSSRLATLGFEAESLWDSTLEFRKGWFILWA